MSVSELVGRFQLRRRATTEAFTAGVRLAQRGAVTLESVQPDEVRAEVRDPEPVTVRILADGDQLVGACSCGCDGPGICRHQVAAAHVLWMQNWRRPQRNR